MYPLFLADNSGYMVVSKKSTNGHPVGVGYGEVSDREGAWPHNTSTELPPKYHDVTNEHIKHNTGQ